MQEIDYQRVTAFFEHIQEEHLIDPSTNATVTFLYKCRIGKCPKQFINVYSRNAHERFFKHDVVKEVLEKLPEKDPPSEEVDIPHTSSEVQNIQENPESFDCFVCGRSCNGTYNLDVITLD